MKLKITKETETEVEIPVPCFFRSKDEQNYVGFLDEKTVVTLYKSGDLTIVKNTTPQYAERDIKEAWSTYHGCTEFEFLEKYDEVIESMSLHPKLAV